MTDQAIETLLYFLAKVYVPGTQQDDFLWAVEQLKALRNKENKAA